MYIMWMERQLDEAECVLCMIEESYEERWHGLKKMPVIVIAVCSAAGVGSTGHQGFVPLTASASSIASSRTSTWISSRQDT